LSFICILFGFSYYLPRRRGKYLISYYCSSQHTTSQSKIEDDTPINLSCVFISLSFCTYWNCRKKQYYGTSRSRRRTHGVVGLLPGVSPEGDS